MAAVTPAWFHPVRQISQFPADGVPLPPPTLLAGVSAMTVDCSAGGVRPKAAGWKNVPDHAFGMVIARAEHLRPRA